MQFVFSGASRPWLMYTFLSTSGCRVDNLVRAPTQASVPTAEHQIDACNCTAAAAKCPAPLP